MSLKKRYSKFTFDQRLTAIAMSPLDYRKLQISIKNYKALVSGLIVLTI